MENSALTLQIINKRRNNSQTVVKLDPDFILCWPPWLKKLLQLHRRQEGPLHFRKSCLYDCLYEISIAKLISGLSFFLFWELECNFTLDEAQSLKIFNLFSDVNKEEKKWRGRQFIQVKQTSCQKAACIKPLICSQKSVKVSVLRGGQALAEWINEASFIQVAGWLGAVALRVRSHLRAAGPQRSPGWRRQQGDPLRTPTVRMQCGGSSWGSSLLTKGHWFLFFFVITEHDDAFFGRGPKHAPFLMNL